MPTAEPTLEELSSDLVVQAGRLVRLVRRSLPQSAGIRILSVLDEQGPLTVTALAQLDQTSQPTATGQVNQLAEQGWVSREPHPGDARSSLVVLTVAGRTELQRIRAANGRMLAERLRAQPTIGTAELATAVALLRAVLDPEPTTITEGVAP